MSKLLHRNLEAKLAALDGPEWDSSDEEENTKEQNENTKNKPGKKKKKNLIKDENIKNANPQKDEKKSEEFSSIIYVGHIPPGFEETEILTFFSQFGKVTNVKLSRSRRTGNPRGYAFVQFYDVEVAAIVADTMSGYFLKGERRLVCHVLPKDKVHPKLFQGAKRNLQTCQSELTSASRIQYWQDKERDVVNKDRSMEGIKKITKKLLSREKKKREQLKMMGIEYDFPGYTASAQNVENTTALEKKEEKKRKVSVDIPETEKDEVPAAKVKKVKQNVTPQKESATPSTPVSKRKISSGKEDEKKAANTPNSKKKTKSAKKRRKSVE